MSKPYDLLDEPLMVCFRSLEDKDLNSTSPEHKGIWCCNRCGSLFEQRASNEGVIKPWNGNHPTEPNIPLLIKLVRNMSAQYANECECFLAPVRLGSVTELEANIMKLVESFRTGGFLKWRRRT